MASHARGLISLALTEARLRQLGLALITDDTGNQTKFGTAFAKSQAAVYPGGLPTSGSVFVSMADRDKREAIFPIKALADLGFRILARIDADLLRRAASHIEGRTAMIVFGILMLSLAPNF